MDSIKWASEQQRDLCEFNHMVYVKRHRRLDSTRWELQKNTFLAYLWRPQCGNKAYLWSDTLHPQYRPSLSHARSRRCCSLHSRIFPVGIKERKELETNYVEVKWQHKMSNRLYVSRRSTSALFKLKNQFATMHAHNTTQQQNNSKSKKQATILPCSYRPARYKHNC